MPRLATGDVETIEEVYADGKLRMRKQVLRAESGSTVNHGKYGRWYPSGKREYEAKFSFGRKTGQATTYHPNGKKWLIENYNDGVRDGKFITYDVNGRKRRVEEFRKGKQHGTWRIWNAEGQLEWEAAFEDGLVVSERRTAAGASPGASSGG